MPRVTWGSPFAHPLHAWRSCTALRTHYAFPCMKASLLNRSRPMRAPAHTERARPGATSSCALGRCKAYHRRCNVMRVTTSSLLLRRCAHRAAAKTGRTRMRATVTAQERACSQGGGRRAHTHTHAPLQHCRASTHTASLLCPQPCAHSREDISTNRRDVLPQRSSSSIVATGASPGGPVVRCPARRRQREAQDAARCAQPTWITSQLVGARSGTHRSDAACTPTHMNA